MGDADCTMYAKWVYAPGGVTIFAGGGGYRWTGTKDATGTEALFNMPNGIAIDSAGNMYIGDSGRIRKITPEAVVTTLSTDSFGSGGNDDTYTAVDSSGNVYISDQWNHTIRKLDMVTGTATVIAGKTNGFKDDTGLSAMFSSPMGLAVDSAGNVYVADMGNNRIRKITPAGVVTTFAGGGTLDGHPYGLKDGTGTAAVFTSPNGLAFDPSGNLFVADTGNNCIRKITPSGVVTTFAGGGSPGGTTAGHANGTGTAATFSEPVALTCDPSGNVYVVDMRNYLIRKITPAGVVTTVAGGGSDGVSSGYAAGVGTEATFNLCRGIVRNSAGVLFVIDRNNNLVRRIEP